MSMTLMDKTKMYIYASTRVHNSDNVLDKSKKKNNRLITQNKCYPCELLISLDTDIFSIIHMSECDV